MQTIHYRQRNDGRSRALGFSDHVVKVLLGLEQESSAVGSFLFDPFALQGQVHEGPHQGDLVEEPSDGVNVGVNLEG